MDKLLFGTGGTPLSAATRSTIDGIRRIAELGLGCMEIEFVRGVRMKEEVAREVARVAKETGVRLSAHGPYYINFNAKDNGHKILASQQMLLQTARIAAICGAESIVFHTAFYMGDPPDKVFETVKENIREVLDQLETENNSVRIRPELMGRTSQFGNINEIIRLCKETKVLAPCIDFAHWHAHAGVNNSYKEFVTILSQIKEQLGKAALSDMHIHLSGIKYGKTGEIKHLNVKESDLKYVELLKALRDFDVKGRIICESPNLEEDALLLQKTFTDLVKNGN